MPAGGGGRRHTPTTSAPGTVRARARSTPAPTLPEAPVTTMRVPEPSGIGTRHIPSPGTGLGRPAFDELLEPLQVTGDPALQNAQFVADVLDEAVGVDVDLSCHTGVVVVEAMKGHHTGVVRSAVGLPGHPPLRVLLGDRR